MNTQIMIITCCFTTTCDVNDVRFVVGCLGLAALEVELGGAMSVMIKY